MQPQKRREALSLSHNMKRQAEASMETTLPSSLSQYAFRHRLPHKEAQVSQLPYTLTASPLGGRTSNMITGWEPHTPICTDAHPGVAFPLQKAWLASLQGRPHSCWLPEFHRKNIPAALSSARVIFRFLFTRSLHFQVRVPLKCLKGYTQDACAFHCLWISPLNIIMKSLTFWVKDVFAAEFLGIRTGCVTCSERHFKSGGTHRAPCTRKQTVKHSL